MLKLNFPFYLASKSPRRKQLLENIYPEIKILDVFLENEIMIGDCPITIAQNLAEEKMDNVAETKEQGLILTADTVVEIDDHIMGKPNNIEEATEMLKKLSGRTHSVITGFCIFNQKTDAKILDFEQTEVTFKKLSNNEIEDYIKTGSPFDKAGAYGIQDAHGSIFVSEIKGCYYNVMGLPVSKIYTSILDII